MPRNSAHRLAWTAVLLASLALAGCASSERSGFADPFARPRPPEPPKPAAPPIDMTGRWMLVALNGAQCWMTFTAAGGANSGRVAPEGGCPGNFFTSRQWAFDQGALVLYDHKQQPLARLTASDPPGSFGGTTENGIGVNLVR